MTILTRHRSSLLATLAITSAPLFAAPPLSAPALAAPQQSESAAPAEPMPGSLSVNGEVIPDIAVRRELVYRLGKRQLQARKLEVFLTKEIERQGLTMADLDVSEDVDTVIANGRQRMKEEFGDSLTEEQILANNKIDVASWRSETKLALLFNKVFLPPNPALWPPVTVEAIASAVDEKERDTFMAGMIAGFKEREAKGEATSATDQQQLMFNMMLRGPILQTLQEASVIKTAQNGIPPELVMVIDDVEIRTDDVFAEIEQDLAPIEWQRTRMWLAKSTAAKQALQKRGVYLDDEAFQVIWDELEARHADTIFPLEQVVLTFKRYPSMNAYRAYYRGLQSYRKLIEDQLSDENLAQHMDRINRLMGLEQVDAEVILLSAYDYKLATWKENGWESAKERAIKVARELAAGGDWDELLMANSDYWDPPIAASKLGEAPNGSRNNRGKLGPRNRNTLLPLVHENDYETFLNGASVGDTIFFDIPVGSYGGPYKGVHGYYIAKVKNRIPATKSYSLADPAQRESIELDYLQVHFTEFAAKAMAEAEIKGL